MTTKRSLKNNILYDTKYKNPNFKEDELTKIINKYDGIICGDDEITKKVINTAVNLKLSRNGELV